MHCRISLQCPIEERVRVLEGKVEEKAETEYPLRFEGVGGSVIEIRKVEGPRGYRFIKTRGPSFMVHLSGDQRALHAFADWVKAHVPKP